MAFYITFAIIIGIFGPLIYRYLRKKQREDRELNAKLDDETIYVEGMGNVELDDLGSIAYGDPEEGIKYKKDHMYREDLMKFEGEFLIPGLALNEERRLSIDDAFLYLQELLGKDVLLNKPALTLESPIFSLAINNYWDVVPVAVRIAIAMDIDPKTLDIGFYEVVGAVDPATLDYAGENENYAAGLYHGKNARGVYEIEFADNIHHEPERMIATIAHEFAHIKLLGENRIEENSEELTDMVPLFYGFGLFNANSVFKLSRNNQSWSTHTLGYLSQVDWSYLFALYRYVRNEKDARWFKQLNATIAKESDLAYKFIVENPGKVLQG